MQAAVQIVTSQIVTSSSCLKVAMYVYYQGVEHIVSPSCSPVDSQLPQLRIHCAQPKPNWKCHTFEGVLAIGEGIKWMRMFISMTPKSDESANLSDFPRLFERKALFVLDGFCYYLLATEVDALSTGRACGDTGGRAMLTRWVCESVMPRFMLVVASSLVMKVHKVATPSSKLVYNPHSLYGLCRLCTCNEHNPYFLIFFE